MRIYREIRHSVIIGHRKPGERLDVEELAHRFDTSVTPVRDALHMLNQEGLVTIKPRSGYYVTRITLKGLRDMLDMRRILELAAIEGVVLHDDVWMPVPWLRCRWLSQVNPIDVALVDHHSPSTIRRCVLLICWRRVGSAASGSSA